MPGEFSETFLNQPPNDLQRACSPAACSAAARSIRRRQRPIMSLTSSLAVPGRVALRPLGPRDARPVPCLSAQRPLPLLSVRVGALHAQRVTLGPSSMQHAQRSSALSLHAAARGERLLAASELHILVRLHAMNTCRPLLRVLTWWSARHKQKQRRPRQAPPGPPATRRLQMKCWTRSLRCSWPHSLRRMSSKSTC